MHSATPKRKLNSEEQKIFIFSSMGKANFGKSVPKNIENAKSIVKRKSYSIY
jgi:hypothetical protein